MICFGEEKNKNPLAGIDRNHWFNQPIPALSF
jgi:hypothetical protein